MHKILESERLKNDALKEKEKNEKLDIATYIFNHEPTLSDVYSYLCIQSQALLSFPNILCLYQLPLLVPPSTANIEWSFSAMNLVCSPLQASLNISNLERLMRINVNSVGVNLPDQMLPILLKKNFKDGREGWPCWLTLW